MAYTRTNLVMICIIILIIIYLFSFFSKALLIQVQHLEIFVAHPAIKSSILIHWDIHCLIVRNEIGEFVISFRACQKQ